MRKSHDQQNRCGGKSGEDKFSSGNQWCSQREAHDIGEINEQEEVPKACLASRRCCNPCTCMVQGRECKVPGQVFNVPCQLKGERQAVDVETIQGFPIQRSKNRSTSDLSLPRD